MAFRRSRRRPIFRKKKVSFKKKSSFRRVRKSYRSSTKRRSMNEMHHVKVKNQGAFSNTFNKVSYIRKMSPAVARQMKLSSINKFINAGQFTIIAGVGAQTTYEAYFATRTTLRQYATNMGLQGSTTASNVVTNTNRWFITSSFNKFDMSNQSDSQIFVDLYFYQCIRDTSASLINLWAASLQDEQNTGSPTYTRDTPGEVPIAHAVLSRFWRCYKIIHHSMNPGQVHTQYYNYGCNKMIDNALIYGSSGDTGAVYLAGITQAMLITVRGSPIWDSGGSISSTAQVKLCANATETTYTGYIADQNFNLTASATYSNGQPRTYNQGSGVIGNQVYTT